MAELIYVDVCLPVFYKSNLMSARRHIDQLDTALVGQTVSLLEVMIAY